MENDAKIKTEIKQIRFMMNNIIVYNKVKLKDCYPFLIKYEHP